MGSSTARSSSSPGPPAARARPRSGAGRRAPRWSRPTCSPFDAGRLADGVVTAAARRHRQPTAGPRWPRGCAEHGRVDALVNNAGVAARERLPDVRSTTWQRTFDINVTGPMLGIQALVPLMPAGSSIVNICSVAAMAGHAAAAYTSSKWALRGLTRTASLELGARHPGQRRDARPGRHAADGVGLAGVHRRRARRDPARPGRRAGRHRADDRVPGLRRLGLLQRRRDRHRRRPHRARLPQGDRRRHPAAGHEARLAPPRRPRSRSSSRTTRRTRCPTSLATWSSSASSGRWRSARRRGRRADPVRRGRSCCRTGRRASATS